MHIRSELGLILPQEDIEIATKGGEQLLVYEPENIISSDKELKIEKARKLKWIYTPYETRQHILYGLNQEEAACQNSLFFKMP